MTALRTPRVRYEEAKAAASLALSQAVADAGVSISSIAVALGVGETLVREWADAHKERAMPVAAVRMLPREVALAVIRSILPEGYAVAEVPSEEPASMSTVIAAHRESSDAVTSAMTALADGRVTREEAVELERRCDAAIAELVTIRALARRARREGCVAVPS